MFNTLKYAKMLEEVGFSRNQSETSIGILVEIMEDRLASKQDLKELEHRLNAKMDQLTVRLGTMLAGSVTLLTAVLTAVIKLA